MKTIILAILAFLAFTAKAHEGVGCDNLHINSLSGSKTESVSGWTFDSVTKGPWNEDPNNWNKCNEAKWFGWTHPGEAAISTVLHGSGRASLDFGNCWRRGHVSVYLNNYKIATAGASTEAKVEFAFHEGFVLKLVEHDTSIIQFNEFSVTECLEDTQQTVEYNVDYPGNDLNDGETIPSPLITATALDCGIECAKEPNCVGFSWNTPENSGFERNCWLKSEMAEETKTIREHVVSGFKPEVNCTWICEEGEVLCSDGSCMLAYDQDAGCPNHCSVQCSEEEQLCPGEVRECSEPDFCIHKDEFCPVFCGEEEILCPGPYEFDEAENKTKPTGPNFCIPTFVENSTCFNHCPTQCPEGEQVCPGGLDSNGCAYEDFCISADEFCPQHCQGDEMWCPGPYDSKTEKSTGPNTCVTFYDEAGCDNHCPVYCSEDEELKNGEEFINWYLGYVYCKQPDYCVPLPEGSNCYLDLKSKLLSGSFDEFEENSPSTCVKNCAGNGFMLAGVKNGNGCYCGDEMPDDSFKASKSLCDNQCPGDKDEFCGGYDALNLFEVKSFE